MPGMRVHAHCRGIRGHKPQARISQGRLAALPALTGHCLKRCANGMATDGDTVVVYGFPFLLVAGGDQIVGRRIGFSDQDSMPPDQAQQVVEIMFPLE